MKKELGITKGKVKAELNGGADNEVMVTALGGAIARFYEDNRAVGSKGEAMANAELFADSINTANQCNLTPSQLLGQRDKLLEACKTVVRGYEDDGMENMGIRDEVFYENCKAAIKATI